MFVRRKSDVAFLKITTKGIEPLLNGSEILQITGENAK